MIGIRVRMLEEMLKMKKRSVGLIAVFLMFGLSACLKTRAQLRDEGEEPHKPVSVQPVQEVRPQEHYVVDELKSEMTQLAGRVEDLERAQKESAAQSSVTEKEELKKIEARLLQLEEEQATLLEDLKKIQESSALGDPIEIYKKGKTQFGAEQYELAAETFGHYLKIPKVKNAQDAIFFRGESYFHLKQYKKAIVEYSKFPEKFPHSTHMAEALLKIGNSFDALGMKEDAKGFYQELLDKYPKSLEAKKARKRVK